MDDPDPDPNTIIFVLIYATLTIMNFLITMGACAISDMNGKKIEDAADDGNISAKRLLKIAAKRPKISDIWLSCTSVNATFSVLLAILCFLPDYAKYGLSVNAYATTQAWLLSVIVPALIIALTASAVFAIFGILVPRRLGSQNSDKLALSLSGFINFIKFISFPFIIVVSSIARFLVKIFGGDPHVDETPVTEDEILSMVDEGEESGVLEEIEKEMINNIFEFGDLTAGEVMTHRTYITAVEINDSVADVVSKAIEEGYSRLPVYEDELDSIKGILYVKDLLKYIGTAVPATVNIKDIMREAMFIPESKKCRDLFSEMTEKHLQMVIVADEYGGVAGILTVEDLIESIVGNIQDEFDDEEEEIEQISEDVFNIDGTSAINEIEELLDIDFPEGEYDTVAGYIMSVIGRIPDPDEHPIVELEGFTFTVAEMDERRIVKILVERIPEEDDQEAEE